jgi:hypothetical protein
MLEEFLYKHDIDLALLQEVTNTKFIIFRRYTSHINMGTEGRGTAILAKDCFLLTDIHRIPTGRGISALFNGIRIINIYAPSGSEKKREKEEFYTDVVERLFTHSSDNMVLAGDFNCVLIPSACTESLNISRALGRLVTGLDLVDVWDMNEARKISTHYTIKGASRLDRIYLLLKSEERVEAIAAAFTDHLAVLLRLSLALPCKTRGKGYWRMKPSYLDDQNFVQNFKQHWEMWRRSAHLYPSRVMWWSRLVKCRIRLLFIRAGVERCREGRQWRISTTVRYTMSCRKEVTVVTKHYH